MTKQQYIKYGWYLVFVILCLVLVFTVFKCNREKRQKSEYKNQVEALDDTLQVVKIQRDYFREQGLEEFRGRMRAESTLRLQGKQLIIRYEKIPTTVNNLDREQLRRAITNY